MRDLTDVAWSALTDRAEKMVTADLPDALRRTPRRLTVASVAVLACLAVPLLGFSTVPSVIVPVGLASGMLCARRGGGFGSAAVVIGAVLALFTSPHLVQLLVGRIDRIAEVASTAAFVAAMAGLAALVVALVRRNRRTAALTAAAIGAFTLPQLATTMLVLINGAEPTGNPWLAYWASMLPYRGWSEESGTAFVPVLFDVLIWYPVLYTFCLSFLLTFCFRATVTQGTPAPTNRAQRTAA
ncbi:hypothetical protein Dfulv_14850 [Dactylosporangium fulvum]|uniref:Integral membrane protein n=1 Tax=Dactylosporangium fulvum TaxID=53359 RepID=A0ABY5W7V5_9ACTN|nr:hypothetical protein [Dactylosporangium fulvum]UWP85440.1 hypothetical protein Dfulv_14850 [Dactylosporangium fulvum]